MKPRIFISSTFYDLKYIREDLANFVRSYNYEPILFEDGDIGYTPGKNLDKSCYEAMRNSDMVILIIGGEYGSTASGEEENKFKEYMSVTREEFRTAVEVGIPIFVMINKKVMTEYEVYEANYVSIEKENQVIKFSTTKNINVFRFIREVKSIVTLPIQEFEKSADIKGFIGKQWADMFKNYLNSLQNEKENRKIENSVSEMKTLIQKMNIMLDSVGKNVLSKNDPKEYEEVINQQEVILFCNDLSESFSVGLNFSDKLYDNTERKRIIQKFIKVLKEIKDTRIDETESIVIDNVLSIFIKYEFVPIKLNLEIIYKKIDLLYDKKNEKEVIETMSKDEYFYKLFKSR